MKSVSSPLPPLPAIARSFVIALPYLLCSPRLPATILLRSDLPETALQSKSSWFHILSIYVRTDGREKKLSSSVPVRAQSTSSSCKKGGNGTQEVEQMQKQTVRRQPRPASRRVHTNGDPAAAREVAHRGNMSLRRPAAGSANYRGDKTDPDSHK